MNVYTGNLKYHTQHPEGLSPVNTKEAGLLNNDAVNIHFTKIGTHERLLTHEAGHWLGLYHTFDPRQFSEEYIDDIPVQSDATDNLSRSCPSMPEPSSLNPNFYTH